MRISVLISFALLFMGCVPVEHPIAPPHVETSSSLKRIANRIFPIKNAETRITKKLFGISISPKTSPIQPERFSGYHTGTDFEIFPSEKDTAIEIISICSGKVRFTGWVKGYGGVLIQDCIYQNESVTVLYGHLDIESVFLQTGAELSTGAKVGNLGRGFSEETDGERKHLHLAIHRGTKLEYRGYVQKKLELSQWIDLFQDS